MSKVPSPAKDHHRPYSVAYAQSIEADPSTFQMMRHSQIIQQCSSSTDEGCDTDHGEMEDVIQPSVPPSIQRLNSYASSSSSSGVVTNFQSKSLSQNLSCDSSRSNFSTFESLDLNLSDCSDLAASLPSCATTMANTMNDNVKEHGKTAHILTYQFSFVCCTFRSFISNFCLSRTHLSFIHFHFHTLDFIVLRASFSCISFHSCIVAVLCFVHF